MPPEERRRAVLEFMADHGIALPPKVIFRGMKVELGIHFSYRTVQTILLELEEKGLVARVQKKALDDGIIEPIPDEETGRRAYYMITSDGRAELDED